MRHNNGVLSTGDAARSYLPLENPLGFGTADWIALSFAIVGLCCIALLRPSRVLLNPLLLRASAFLENRGPWFFFSLTLVLRMMLLAAHPVPVPSGADDFAYLLLGDTFAHGRWTNPQIPNSSFFETVFVLQQPTYGSIFPPAQGLILAVGQWIFGVPWVGVLISMSLLAALCHWMLCGWFSRRWAGMGALLAVFIFGPLCSWMNCYWGGAPAAIAGCLVVGSLARLRQSRHPIWALVAGLGLGLHLLARPFETGFLAFSVILFWVLFLRSQTRTASSLRFAALFSLGMAPGLAILVLHAHEVTTRWTKLPYMLSREQYGVPTTFTFQPNPVPTRSLTQSQKNDFDAQAAVHGDGRETPARFVARFLFRLRFLRFFAYAPLYLGLLFLFWKWPAIETGWAWATVLLFLVGTNIYPYFYPHYIAALTSVILLLIVFGLQSIRNSRLGPWAAAWLLTLCALQFTFWYGVQISGTPALILDTGRFETWDYLNFGDPQSRLLIEAKLSEIPGKQLVFVSYSSNHGFEEWISNSADTEHARVVRARDLGPSGNLVLIRQFPGRSVWLLYPDSHPPQLKPYPYLFDDLMVIPKSEPNTPQPPVVKPGKSDKVSDWLENVK